MLSLVLWMALLVTTNSASLLGPHAAAADLGLGVPVAAAATRGTDSTNASVPPSAPGLPDEWPLELTFGDQSIPFGVMAVFALPGEEVSVRSSASDPDLELRAEGGTIRATGESTWTWTAPLTPGTYPIHAARPDGSGATTLNTFVMVPYDRMRGGAIDGYRIGAYPARRPNQPPEYERPRGFVRLDAENADVLVSPHFRLAQFACKAGEGYPKYLVLRPALLVKLERLLELANDHGVEASTFQLMSAYRTPVYNRGIGNPTTFSRHQYGDAADIYIDEHPRDGRMDDLNGDGRQNRDDARFLGQWAAQLDAEGEDLVGGLGTYGSTDSHGPFVHVDARGRAARW